MADSTTPLDTVAADQAGKEITVDELFDAHSPASGFGRHASACAGLVWAYYPAVMMISGTPTKIAGGTLTLTASVTNYVRLNSGGTISVLTSAPSGWPGPLASGAFALYEIVCGADGPTSWQDWRPSFNG